MSAWPEPKPLAWGVLKNFGVYDVNGALVCIVQADVMLVAAQRLRVVERAMPVPKVTILRELEKGHPVGDVNWFGDAFFISVAASRRT